MSWRVVVRPEIEKDLRQAADWYDSHEEGLGSRFKVLQVFEALAKNPLLRSRKHSAKSIRWRYAKNFPYRVIYEVLEREKSIVIAAVIHAARHDRHWKRRL